MEFILNLADKESLNDIIGGKAASLAKMIQAGLPVPEGYVIKMNAFECKNGELYLKKEAQEDLSELLHKLPIKYAYAVRSSAVNEDGALASFAGAYETITDVTVDKIEEAVRTVAASASSPRVRNYACNMMQGKNGSITGTPVPDFPNSVCGSATGTPVSDFPNPAFGNTIGSPATESSSSDCNGEPDTTNPSKTEIAVVIQRFVKAEIAGVLFTSDPLTGSAAMMRGNFVFGEGEQLVSGSSNAQEFSIKVMKYEYIGADVFGPYARKMYHYAKRILQIYQTPMDIEWAVAEGKLYLLQARPITTLRRLDRATFTVNGSLSGEYLMSRTNVAEIFTSAVSPATFSILEAVCESLGVPCFIDNICGQPYANISVVCSLLRSFGISEKRSYEMIADIAGKLPDGVTIPVFPYNRRMFLKAVYKMLVTHKKKKYYRMSKHEFADRMGDFACEMIDCIKTIQNSEELALYWEQCQEYMSRVLGAIVTSLKTKELLSTRTKLEKICGAELANALCEGCTSEEPLESMKPLLCLEQVIRGEMSKEEYRRLYGHRSVNEMELAKPYPYEDPNFPDNRITAYLRQSFEPVNHTNTVKQSGVRSATEMQHEQAAKFCSAKELFINRYPKKRKWIEKTLSDYAEANRIREQIRSRGVRLFCMIREFYKKAGELAGIGDDIFMLELNEVLELMHGNMNAISNIPKRKKNYERYMEYPTFPNIICGRFIPEEWIQSPIRRLDFYSAEGCRVLDTDKTYPADENQLKKEVITGFAGAAGIVEGRVRVIMTLDEAEAIEDGEILVTTATNIGWTIIFPRLKAIVTDIGAPLSHAAIVAREFGIPAVVGCGNATTLLNTGDRVRIDGSVGLCQKILDDKCDPQ